VNLSKPCAARHDDLTDIACERSAGHPGEHGGWSYVTWPADDPPEDDPDDAEAQRIAEEYADAADELARIEAEDARDGLS